MQHLRPDHNNGLFRVSCGSGGLPSSDFTRSLTSPYKRHTTRYKLLLTERLDRLNNGLLLFDGQFWEDGQRKNFMTCAFRFW